MPLTKTVEGRRARGECTRCGKPAEGSKWHCKPCRAWHIEFYRNLRKTRYDAGLCVRCGKTPRFETYHHCQECRERNKTYALGNTQQPVVRFKILMRNARTRARKDGRAFEVSAFNHILETPPLACASCKVSLDFSSGRGRSANSPSLDRFDNRRGYVCGNVAVICSRCNSLKSDASAEELYALASYMANGCPTPASVKQNKHG